MITRILAPVDGCERSEAILPYVEELSNRLGAHVTLLHVFPPSLHLQRDAHAQYIETLASQLRDRLRHAGVDVSGVALEGKPNREIADYASRSDISLIAASPHSQSSDGHWTIGRTADKVIRETSKPVLLAGTESPAGGARDALLSRVLVPLDGSRASRDVLPHVEAIVRRKEDGDAGTVWLIHVIPADHYAAGPVIAKRVPYTKSESDELRGQASRYLEEVATRLRAGGRLVDTLVATGDAATMILAAARENGANLIAMTTHGYSGFSRLFLGSIAERVLHNATTPLLLVKPVRY
jgi:nucleotide-binding universal stress UspA family protein